MYQSYQVGIKKKARSYEHLIHLRHLYVNPVMVTIFFGLTIFPWVIKEYRQGDESFSLPVSSWLMLIIGELLRFQTELYYA
jgi:hypothetical protein